MKHFDFFPVLVVLVFCTFPFLFIGFLDVAHNKDVVFGIFLQLIGVFLLVFVLVIEYKDNK